MPVSNSAGDSAGEESDSTFDRGLQFSGGSMGIRRGRELTAVFNADSEPLRVLGGTWAMGDRSMTISSSPSSSNSRIA